MAILPRYLCVLCSYFEWASLLTRSHPEFLKKRVKNTSFFLPSFIRYKEKTNSGGSVFAWLLLCEPVVLK